MRSILLCLLISLPLMICSQLETNLVVSRTTTGSGTEIMDEITISVISNSDNALSAASYGFQIGFQSSLAEFVSAEQLQSWFFPATPTEPTNQGATIDDRTYDKLISAGAAAGTIAIPASGGTPVPFLKVTFKRLGTIDTQGDNGGFVFVYNSAQAPFGSGGAIVEVGSGDNTYVVTDPLQLLPVEMSYFTASKRDLSSVLNWETVSEINNDYFDVERSADGRSFQKIGKIQGNGTTTETQNYEFIDREPLTGINYYRLKQHDYNGDYEYSNVETVDFRDGTEGDVTIFPNPAADYVNVSLDRSYDGIRITNQLGQLVEVLPAQDYESNQFKLDLSGYAPGVYFLEAKLGLEIVNKQFVKVK